MVSALTYNCMNNNLCTGGSHSMEPHGPQTKNPLTALLCVGEEGSHKLARLCMIRDALARQFKLLSQRICIGRLRTPFSHHVLCKCTLLYGTILWSSSFCVVSCFQHDNKHSRNQTHCCCCVNTICVRSNSNDIHEVLAANTGFSIVEMRHHYTTPPLPSANQQRKNSA